MEHLVDEPQPEHRGGHRALSAGPSRESQRGPEPTFLGGDVPGLRLEALLETTDATVVQHHAEAGQ
ncbi:MAG: hypothetical protein ACREQM_16740 [Candidatus Dormibacteraceae bacterium]